MKSTYTKYIQSIPKKYSWPNKPPSAIYCPSSKGDKYPNCMLQNLDDCFDMVMNRKIAAGLLVDGSSLGGGKTTMAVHMADYVNGGPIDLDLQLALGGEELMEKAIKCYDKDKHVIIYDEAGDLRSTRAMQDFNYKLTRFFELHRALKILIIVVMPKFYRLDTAVFDLDVFQGLIHMTRKTDWYTEFVAYDQQQMAYIKNAVRDKQVSSNPYRFGIINFRGRALDLPPARSMELEDISLSDKVGEIRKQLEKKDKKKGGKK